MEQRPPETDLSLFSDAHIADMPLHTVTEVLGTEGLIRRFELEIAQFSPEEIAQLMKAYEWAMQLHAQDQRYREPAANHILRVAIRIIHHYGVADINLITAALLHDSVEDHASDIVGNDQATSEEALAVLAAEFNDDVAGLVKSVTNPDYEEGVDKLIQYQAHVRKTLLEDDPRARVIKVSDFTDNAMGVIYMPTEGAAYRAHRYSVLIPTFETAVMLENTPLSYNAKAHIIKQLEETRRRLSVFLNI